MFDFINWAAVGEFAIGVGIWSLSIPVTIGLIYGINRFSRSKIAKRFDAWFDGKN